MISNCQHSGPGPIPLPSTGKNAAAAYESVSFPVTKIENNKKRGLNLQIEERDWDLFFISDRLSRLRKTTLPGFMN